MNENGDPRSATAENAKTGPNTASLFHPRPRHSKLEYLDTLVRGDSGEFQDDVRVYLKNKNYAIEQKKIKIYRVIQEVLLGQVRPA